MMITVYSKPNCVACRQIKKLLEKSKVEFKEIDITKNASVRDELTAEGYKSLPVVKSEVLNFSGYDPEQLEKVIAFYHFKKDLKF